jgi:hypothetical protein
VLLLALFDLDDLIGDETVGLAVDCLEWVKKT